MWVPVAALAGLPASCYTLTLLYFTSTLASTFYLLCCFDSCKKVTISESTTAYHLQSIMHVMPSLSRSIDWTPVITKFCVTGSTVSKYKSDPINKNWTWWYIDIIDIEAADRIYVDISMSIYRHRNDISIFFDILKHHKYLLSLHYMTLHYIRVIYSGLSTRLLNHYYTRRTELETENS